MNPAAPDARPAPRGTANRSLHLLLALLPFLPALRIALLRSRFAGLAPLRWLPGDSTRLGPPRRLHAGPLASPPPAGVTLQTLFPEAPLERPLPFTNSTRVRTKFSACRQARTTAAYVATITDGRYVGDDGAGTVIAPGDVVLAELSRPRFRISDHPGHLPVFTRFRLPPPRHVPVAIVLATVAADRAYGHWLKDLVPRIGYLRDGGVDFARATVVINHRHLPYQLETLQCLSIPTANVVVPDADTHLQADRLIVPSLVHPGLNSDFFGYPARGLDFVRQTFLPSPPPPAATGRRIFISRRKTLRSIATEPALLAGLAGRGFESHVLEDLPVAAQARLFHGADLVVGPHGAGFNNLIFSRPGTAVMEIFSPDFIVTNFWGLCHTLGLRYGCYCEDEKFRGVKLNRLQREHDIALDVPRFLEHLDAFAGVARAGV